MTEEEKIKLADDVGVMALLALRDFLEGKARFHIRPSPHGNDNERGFSIRFVRD